MLVGLAMHAIAPAPSTYTLIELILLQSLLVVAIQWSLKPFNEQEQQLISTMVASFKARGLRAGGQGA